ncbi:hypothetical protein K3495_g4351 [Podosphaera aphanis]|nr:hypothetical protein K3495_g4351 [Podosphaera aphanis]
MGIPRLLTHLNPYGIQEPLRNVDVVLDGHAFAYHVYELCIRGRSNEHHALQVQPTYREITEKAIAWLDLLQGYDVVVKKIYFDGFLPRVKLKHRSARLKTLTKRLSTFYRHHSFPCKKRSTISLNDMSLFGTTLGVESLIYGAPPLPYLVPAVLETLCKSDKYKSLTKVVPWEADHYCSNYVKNHGGLVLSGDSDFFVHDLGLKGAVAFFRDIKQLSLGQGISAKVFRPTTICSRLGLNLSHGLSSLAFELVKDSSGSFHELLARSRSLEAIKRSPRKYETFIEDYTITIADVDPLVEKSAAILLHCLQNLDPRISEYVLQFPTFAKIAGQTFRIGFLPNKDSHHIFLPFNLDSPARTSSWEVSSAIRQLAYGLINIVVPESEKTATIFEHRKQQGEISGRELQLPTNDQIFTATVAFCDKYSRVKNHFLYLATHETWVVMTILEEIEWSSFQERTSLASLAPKLLADFASDSTSDWEYSWDLIHFFAQIHASLYSFRILRQISGIITRYHARGSLSAPILRLHQLLESLPLLRDLPHRDDLNTFLRTHLASINSAAEKLVQ